MRTPFALPMLVAVLVAVSSRVDADTLKFAWWRMDQIAMAVGLNQSAIDERTQVLAAANVDVMAGVGLWSRADGVFPSSNGYRLENGKTVTNGSYDGFSRVFALSHAFDAVESANASTPMVHGTKNVPGANATVAWTVFDAGSTRFAVLSGFIYQLYNAKYKNNLDALVENIATNGNPVIVFGLEDACETRTLTLSDFEDCGLYAVRDGTADGQWIFCSDQAMATAAASTVADLPGATAYGTVGYTAEFSYEGEDAGVGYHVVFKQGNVAPVGTRVRSRGGTLASAAAVLGCGFLKLSKICPDKEKAASYRAEAIKIAKSLSSDAYFAKPTEIGGFVLKHAVASKPDGADIDVPLNYGDYYYLELLMELRRE